MYVGVRFSNVNICLRLKQVINIIKVLLRLVWQIRRTLKILHKTVVRRRKKKGKTKQI